MSKTKLRAWGAVFSLVMMISSGALAKDSFDIVKDSGGWWGLTIEELGKKFGFSPKDYAISDSLTTPGVKNVFLPRSVLARFEPKYLPVSSFDFDANGKLAMIGGTVGDDPKMTRQMIEQLKKSYGAPKIDKMLFGARSLRWDFKDTVMYINVGSFFSIIPSQSKK